MQVEFKRSQQRREAIGVVDYLHFARVERNAEAVVCRVRLGDEQPRVRALHWDDLSAHEHFGILRLRKPCPDLSFVRSQEREWIAMAALYN
jgi:hypothetical protein